jgi:hypothetical protein
MNVRCMDCGWEQDDFWNEDYNPLDALAHWREVLLTADLDDTYSRDGKYAKDDGTFKTYQDVLADECESAAKHIRGMIWRTSKDFSDDPDPRCPSCGSERVTDKREDQETEERDGS